MNPVPTRAAVFGTILSAAAWLTAAPAIAQRSQNWESCSADTTLPDPRIAACTAIIESRTETPANLAIAYCDRGIAYQKKGDLARATADFNEAIRLDSSKAFVFYNRGLVFYAKRNLDRAMADCTEAVRLDPKLAGRCSFKP